MASLGMTFQEIAKAMSLSILAPRGILEGLGCGRADRFSLIISARYNSYKVFAGCRQALAQILLAIFISLRFSFVLFNH
jgi:hypothetical protein